MPLSIVAPVNATRLGYASTLLLAFIRFTLSDEGQVRREKLRRGGGRREGKEGGEKLRRGGWGQEGGEGGGGPSSCVDLKGGRGGDSMRRRRSPHPPAVCTFLVAPLPIHSVLCI